MDGFIIETKTSKYKNYKLAAVIIGFLYCLFYISTKADWHFIDNVNLIIHEAGHVLFSFFGETLYIAGGSIFQVIVPLVFAGYFFIREAYYSTTVMLYWAGLSLINVSVYAADAVRMKLPLLTGDTDGHDWNNLLFKFGLLHYTDFIATLILVLGVTVILIGLLLTIYSWSQESQ